MFKHIIPFGAYIKDVSFKSEKNEILEFKRVRDI